MQYITELEKLTMTSLEISELTGKPHYQVMRDVRNMLKALDMDTSNLVFTRLIKGLGDNPDRQSKFYKLNEELTLTLLTGYSLKLRQLVIDRWLQLEEELKTKTKSKLELAKEQVALIELENKRASANMVADSLKINDADRDTLFERLGIKPEPPTITLESLNESVALHNKAEEERINMI